MVYFNFKFILFMEMIHHTILPPDAENDFICCSVTHKQVGNPSGACKFLKSNLCLTQKNLTHKKKHISSSTYTFLGLLPKIKCFNLKFMFMGMVYFNFKFILFMEMVHHTVLSLDPSVPSQHTYIMLV